MKRIVTAALLSLLLHALAAAGLALYLADTAPRTLPRLDLSAVELSLSEEHAPDTRAAIQPLPAAPDTPRTARAEPPPDAAPDTPPAEEPPLPPSPDSAALPQPPPPDPPRLQTPPEKKEPRAAETLPPAAASAPIQPAPQQARIDAPAKLRRRLRPDYPAGARRRGEEGDVGLEVAVSDSGRVETVAVAHSSGFPELDAAAVAAARTMRLTPASSGGKPVASRVRLTVRFRLKE